MKLTTFLVVLSIITFSIGLIFYAIFTQKCYLTTDESIRLWKINKFNHAIKKNSSSVGINKKRMSRSLKRNEVLLTNSDLYLTSG